MMTSAQRISPVLWSELICSRDAARLLWLPAGCHT